MIRIRSGADRGEDLAFAVGARVRVGGVFGGTFSPDPNASAFPVFKQFPKPNYPMTPEETDNVASFASGKTIGDSVP